jgi:type II secretory pathway pseudopilin PulG
MRTRARASWARRLAGEGGFTIVEAMIAITILSVVSVAVAQSITFGLRTSGMSRQRLAARAAGEQQMELARALNYDSLVLDDASDIPHDADPSHPDHWVDQGAQTFDADGDGPLAPEPIVRQAGASPALHHVQSPFVAGNTEFEIYLYVTWVDTPVDGVDAADDPDGNGDSVSDADGQDQKRVTVAVRWRDLGTFTWYVERMSSLFSDGVITYHESGGTASPSASASPSPSPSPSPSAGGDGSILVAGGATYTTQAQVTLTLSSPGAVEMRFSDDGVTWSEPIPYDTSTIYTLPSGDGTKTVYVWFLDAAGDTIAEDFDSIVLDSTPPAAPSGLTASSSAGGVNTNVSLSWSAPSPIGDVVGYRVYRRLTTSSTWTQVSCGGSGTTCSDSFKKQDNYEYYVVSYDAAGNESAHSNHITV